MTCTAHIWRKQAVWIGKESTAGTKVSASDWIPKTSGVMTPVISTIQDTSGYWVIDEVYDVQPVKEHTELNIEGIADDYTLSLLMLWVYGAVTTTWSWPYTHAFTRNNTNCHQSFTLRGYDPVATHSAAYAMVNTFEINVVSEEFANYSCNFLAKKMVSESTPSVNYSQGTLFRARDVNVYIADTEAGLSSATAIKLTSIRINFEKNLMLHQAIGSEDIDKIFNQQLNVSGDFEAVFSDATYLGLVRGGTKKYMKISLVNTSATLSDDSTNPTITFTLGKVSFETRSQTSGNNDIIKQTVWFIASFNETDGYSTKCTVINDRATV